MTLHHSRLSISRSAIVHIFWCPTVFDKTITITKAGRICLPNERSLL